FDFRQHSAHPRTGSKRVAAAAKFLTNRADIYSFVFGTHADPHLAFGKFFKEHGYDDAANCAEMIDQSFIVFGNHTKFCSSVQPEAKRCGSSAFTKLHRLQQLPQEFESASGVILVQLLANFADVEVAVAHQLRRNFKRARAGFWILKGARIS